MIFRSDFSHILYPDGRPVYDISRNIGNPSQRSNALEDFSDEGLKSIDHGTYGGDHDGVEYAAEDVQTTTVARPSRFSKPNRERERERAFRGSFLRPTTQEVRCEFKAQQGLFVSTLQTSRIKSWVKTYRSLNLDERVYPRCSPDLLYYPTVLPILREIVSYGRRQQSFRGHRERGETEGQRTNFPRCRCPLVS